MGQGYFSRQTCHGDPQSGDYDIYIMNVDGSEQARLTQTPGAASYPTMSPDGQKIAYSYNEEDGDSSRIMIMNADGSGQEMLIENGSIPRFAPEITENLDATGQGLSHPSLPT